MRVETKDFVDGRDSDGNGLVAARSELSGKHTGAMLGISATGRDFGYGVMGCHATVGQQQLATASSANS